MATALTRKPPHRPCGIVGLTWPAVERCRLLTRPELQELGDPGCRHREAPQLLQSERMMFPLVSTMVVVPDTGMVISTTQRWKEMTRAHSIHQPAREREQISTACQRAAADIRERAKN